VLQLINRREQRLDDKDNNEYIKETVSAKPLVTYSQAQDALQTLMTFF
jgi:hypothetical protein